MCKIDHMRVMTIRALPGIDIDEGVEVKIDLCPGARVYSYTIVVRVVDGELGIPDIGATLHLQDSDAEIPMEGCLTVSFSADLPGLFFPAFAKLSVPPNARATMILTYGVCAS